MKPTKSLLYGLLALAVLSLAAPAAQADRYHVRNGGILTEGPSVPEDWSVENCYATLSLAATAATPADSVLLYPQDHGIFSSVVLTSFLGNRDLSSQAQETRLIVQQFGTLAADPNLTRTEIRGVDFLGAMDPRNDAGLTVTNPDSLVSELVVTGCNFSDFQGRGYAAIGGSVLRGASPGRGMLVLVTDCTFSTSTTEGPGGAVFFADGFHATFTRCDFTGNMSSTTGGRGGAVACDADTALSSLTFEDCLFADNLAFSAGGAISADNAHLTVRDSEIRGSRTGIGTDLSEGAGLVVQRTAGHLQDVHVEITDCLFTDNVGDMTPQPQGGDGGGILIKGDPGRPVTVAISDCTFQNNYNAQGAGVYVGRFASGSVVRCRFLDNRSWYQGGGAMKGGALPENTGELAYFDYCEFSGNEAGYRPDGSYTGEYSRGGGLMVRHYPRAFVRNCTFVENRVNTFSYGVGDGFAHALEGGAWYDLNLCELINCVFWGENGNDVQVRSENGGLAEVMHVAVQLGELVVGGSPQTGTIYLGSFPFTAPGDHVPAFGSPLVDGAVELGFIQDVVGTTVPLGNGPDIGCFESQHVVGIADPAPLRDPALTAYPNPFNPRTTVTAVVPASGEARVAVFDLRGRLVRELHRGPLPAGTHAWVWDGRDTAGGAAPTGLYVARLLTSGGDRSHKLTLVR